MPANRINLLFKICGSLKSFIQISCRSWTINLKQISRYLNIYNMTTLTFVVKMNVNIIKINRQIQWRGKKNDRLNIVFEVLVCWRILRNFPDFDDSRPNSSTCFKFSTGCIKLISIPTSTFYLFFDKIMQYVKFWYLLQRNIFEFEDPEDRGRRWCPDDFLCSKFYARLWHLIERQILQLLI